MRVSTFGEIEKEFQARVNRIVWGTVATVDGAGRPRSQLLHPRRVELFSLADMAGGGEPTIWKP